MIKANKTNKFWEANSNKLKIYIIKITMMLIQIFQITLVLMIICLRKVYQYMTLEIKESFMAEIHLRKKKTDKESNRILQVLDDLQKPFRTIYSKI